MTKTSQLVAGFSPSETQAITQHLKKLLPHLTPNRFILVGGLAIKYHLGRAGIPYQSHPFNDLDLIIEDESVILPSVTQDFLIAHRHLPDKPWFYIVLVDPRLKVKVDLFDYQMKPETTTKVNFERFELPVVSIEDQLVKLVWDIQRISAQQKVEPKQFTQTQLLAKIADLDLADQIWKRKQFAKYPPSLLKAIDRANQIAEAHPDWLQEKPPPSEKKPYLCPHCVSSKTLPITPMNQIYQAIGSAPGATTQAPNASTPNFFISSLASRNPHASLVHHP